MTSHEYTVDDHRSRPDDAYALAKYELTLDAIAKHHPHARHILNVGCGGGFFNELAIQRGYIVRAYEPDDVAWGIAKEYSHPNLVVVHGGIEDVPTTSVYDVVVLHDVLEHIEDDAAAVDRIVSFMDQAGIAILSVPACQWLYGLHDEKLGHFRRYSKKQLTGLFDGRAKVVGCRYFGLSGVPYVLLLSRILRRPIAENTTVRSRGTFMKALLKIEKMIHPPVGSSLIVCVKTK